MTNPVFTTLYCSACGRAMGRKPGVEVVTNLLCDDPLCSYQGPSSLNEARDSLVVAAALDKVPATQIAFENDMSRQRVYQIVNEWKQGV